MTMLGLPDWNGPKLQTAFWIHYCIDEYTFIINVWHVARDAISKLQIQNSK